MPDGVLDERLQEHWRELRARHIPGDIPRDPQPVPQSRLLDRHVGLGQLELLAQRDLLPPVDREKRPQQLTESPDDLECLTIPLGDDERADGVERVEQEVRLQLQRQRPQLRRREIGPQSLGTELLASPHVERTEVVPGAEDEGIDDEREVIGADELGDAVPHHGGVRGGPSSGEPHERGACDVEREDERSRDGAVCEQRRQPPASLEGDAVRKPDDPRRRDGPDEKETDLLDERRTDGRLGAAVSGDELGQRDDVDDGRDPQAGDDAARGGAIGGWLART